jgi:D-arabinose 1-dehydrogenase-like Zn-dependent alcohol dehydrogenase
MAFLMATHSNVSLTATSIGAGGTGTIAVQNGTGAIWSNVAKTTAQGKLQLEGEGADLVINGVSLKEILDGITDRLSILQPKPELLEKYENLRLAYEHYKTLEALLHEDNNGQ